MKTVTKDSTKTTKKTLKERAVSSLRSSFEFEGVFFTDEEIQEMIAEVRNKGKKVVKT